MINLSNQKRILLKLSGETLLGKQHFGIDTDSTSQLASSLKAIVQEGFQMGIVIGGGNIFRGLNLRAMGVQRSPADQMGMLATLINGIALQEALTASNCPAKLMSALECPDVAESYNWHKANEISPQASLSSSWRYRQPLFHH